MNSVCFDASFSQKHIDFERLAHKQQPSLMIDAVFAEEKSDSGGFVTISISSRVQDIIDVQLRGKTVPCCLRRRSAEQGTEQNKKDLRGRFALASTVPDVFRKRLILKDLCDLPVSQTDMQRAVHTPDQNSAFNSLDDVQGFSLLK